MVLAHGYLTLEYEQLNTNSDVFTFGISGGSGGGGGGGRVAAVVTVVMMAVVVAVVASDGSGGSGGGGHCHPLTLHCQCPAASQLGVPQRTS